jgi:hypothetical protein
MRMDSPTESAFQRFCIRRHTQHTLVAHSRMVLMICSMRGRSCMHAYHGSNLKILPRSRAFSAPARDCRAHGRLKYPRRYRFDFSRSSKNLRVSIRESVSAAGSCPT